MKPDPCLLKFRDNCNFFLRLVCNLLRPSLNAALCFFHLSTVIINSFLKNSDRLPASALALLKPCQADTWLYHNGTVTASLTVAAGGRGDLPQLEKGTRSCHCPRENFLAAGSYPVRGQRGNHDGFTLCCRAVSSTGCRNSLCFHPLLGASSCWLKVQHSFCWCTLCAIAGGAQ